MQLFDGEQALELVWFTGGKFIENKYPPGSKVLVYGRISFYKGVPRMAHPEMELQASDGEGPSARGICPFTPAPTS